MKNKKAAFEFIQHIQGCDALTMQKIKTFDKFMATAVFESRITCQLIINAEDFNTPSLILFKLEYLRHQFREQIDIASTLVHELLIKE